MELFDVYSQWNVRPVRAKGARIWGEDGRQYLDFYGGHGVISIGHSHPVWSAMLKAQIDRLSFYSNGIKNDLQEELAQKLGALSGYENHRLFLCNTGAEAVENALKIASFHNGKKKVVTFEKGYHGRTTGALAVTDDVAIRSPFNVGLTVQVLPFNDETALKNALQHNDVSSLIIEGIQGIAGIYQPDVSFLQAAERLCKKYGTLLILDEIQSGFGRTGRFFAHHHAGIRADLITTAKGMGNGFPVGAVLIHQDIQAWKGMLGATFGGSHLACAATLGVLEVMEQENLMDNAQSTGIYMAAQLAGIEHIVEIRGQGLMVGVEFDFPIRSLQLALLNAGIFTGYANHPNVLRLLPPLCISRSEVDFLVEKLYGCLSDMASVYNGQRLQPQAVNSMGCKG